MLGKVIVQGVSSMLLLGAAAMFFSGVQAGALQQKPPAPAPIVVVADANAQSAPLDLF